MKTNVKGKWALITGANRGIGYRITKFMAAEGCNLVLHSRNLEHTKKVLEEVIKSTKNMRGFTSLRALYLFEKSEECEDLARQYDSKKSTMADNYRIQACYLRCDADEAEAEYGQMKREKVKKETT